MNNMKRPSAALILALSAATAQAASYAIYPGGSQLVNVNHQFTDLWSFCVDAGASSETLAVSAYNHVQSGSGRGGGYHQVHYIISLTDAFITDESTGTVAARLAGNTSSLSVTASLPAGCYVLRVDGVGSGYVSPTGLATGAG